MQSAFKFSDVLFVHSQMEPPIVEASGQIDIFGRSLGQADLLSDNPLYVRLWVRMTFSQALGQTDLWSDIPSKQRNLVAKCVTTLVRLTSGQMYPQQRHLMATCVTTLVRLASGHTYSQHD